MLYGVFILNINISICKTLITNGNVPINNCLLITVTFLDTYTKKTDSNLSYCFNVYNILGTTLKRSKKYNKTLYLFINNLIINIILNIFVILNNYYTHPTQRQFLQN